MRVTPSHLDHLLHPQFGRDERVVIARGLAASPGAGVGRVYFDADAVVAATQRGERAILVRTETSPDDVHGMQAAEAVLTSRGGLVSHAAVVARGWGIPAVVGAADIDIEDGHFVADGIVVREGEWISVDGTAGEVMLGELAAHFGRAAGGARGRARMGRRDPRRKTRRASERRQRARRGPRALVRRRGHRPVPHRAHVPRRTAAHGAAHDPRRHGGKGSRRARGAARDAARRLRGDPRRDGRLAGDRAAARSPTARVPPAHGRADCPRGSRRARRDVASTLYRGPIVARAEPDARDPRACGSGS